MFLINAKTRGLLAGLMVAIILMTLCACTLMDGVGRSIDPLETKISYDPVIGEEVPALAKYIEFREKAMVDSSVAIRDCCHYEDEELREIALRQVDPTISYEILEYKKLSDYLWVIKCFRTSRYDPNGAVLDHFVGIIDGKYYVMMSLNQVPAELQDWLDLEQYKHDGVFAD